MNEAIEEQPKPKQKKENKKPLTIAERIKKLDDEQKQLDSRRKNILARNKQDDLKFQNRRKYILGSLVLKSIDKDDDAKIYVRELLSLLNEKDKKYFSDLLIPESQEVKKN